MLQTPPETDKGHGSVPQDLLQSSVAARVLYDLAERWSAVKSRDGRDARASASVGCLQALSRGSTPEFETTDRMDITSLLKYFIITRGECHRDKVENASPPPHSTPLSQKTEHNLIP